MLSTVKSLTYYYRCMNNIIDTCLERHCCGKCALKANITGVFFKVTLFLVICKKNTIENRRRSIVSFSFVCFAQGDTGACKFQRKKKTGQSQNFLSTVRSARFRWLDSPTALESPPDTSLWLCRI